MMEPKMESKSAEELTMTDRFGLNFEFFFFLNSLKLNLYFMSINLIEIANIKWKNKQTNKINKNIIKIIEKLPPIFNAKYQYLPYFKGLIPIKSF